MRVGTLISVPNEYSHYGRIIDKYGIAYSVEEGDIPDDAKVGSQHAYKVEIWGNDGGLAYGLEEE